MIEPSDYLDITEDYLRKLLVSHGYKPSDKRVVDVIKNFNVAIENYTVYQYASGITRYIWAFPVYGYPWFRFVICTPHRINPSRIHYSTSLNGLIRGFLKHNDWEAREEMKRILVEGK